VASQPVKATSVNPSWSSFEPYDPASQPAQRGKALSLCSPGFSQSAAYGYKSSFYKFIYKKLQGRPTNLLTINKLMPGRVPKTPCQRTQSTGPAYPNRRRGIL
jgi:hypothetical protein